MKLEACFHITDTQLGNAIHDFFFRKKLLPKETLQTSSESRTFWLEVVTELKKCLSTKSFNCIVFAKDDDADPSVQQIIHNNKPAIEAEMKKMKIASLTMSILLSYLFYQAMEAENISSEDVANNGRETRASATGDGKKNQPDPVMIANLVKQAWNRIKTEKKYVLTVEEIKKPCPGLAGQIEELEKGIFEIIQKKMGASEKRNSTSTGGLSLSGNRYLDFRSFNMAFSVQIR